MTITEIVQCIMDGGEVPASAALGAVEARALLNVAAADRSSLVRSEAVEALEQQDDTSSLPVLTKRLRAFHPVLTSERGHQV